MPAIFKKSLVAFDQNHLVPVSSLLCLRASSQGYLLCATYCVEHGKVLGLTDFLGWLPVLVGAEVKPYLPRLQYLRCLTAHKMSGSEKVLAEGRSAKRS